MPRPDARPAARPAQHAPRLRAARSPTWPTSPRCIVPELWHHDIDRRDGRGGPRRGAASASRSAASRWAATSAFEILRRAPERVERLALMDTQATPDSPESTRAPPRPGRADPDRPLPRRAALAAAAASCIARHLDDPADHPADPRHGRRDRRRRLRARAARDHRPARQPAAAGRHRACRPW